MPQTLFDKLWSRHVVRAGEDGRDLIYIDRLLVHENSFHAFENLRRKGRKVRHPEKIFGFSDHYVPTARGQISPDPEIRDIIRILDQNCREFGITHFGLGNPNQGILHVVGPELGITRPGFTIAGADSHTSTHGALGAFAFGVGASDAEHILATQTLWMKRPKTMRVTVSGELADGVEPKDIILGLIGQIGVRGGVGHVIEYSGSAIAAMSVEGRMTVCNMSIEAGARAGMVGVDDTTLCYLNDRRYLDDVPNSGAARREWATLTSDKDSVFDREVTLDAASVEPTVTWGTSPEQIAGISGTVPDPRAMKDADAREKCEIALEYMRLTPGTPIDGIAVDKVFIGSCTNGRIEDLRRAAKVLKGRTVKVPTQIVPGSMAVKRRAEVEDLHRIFIDAGCEWHDSGCSLCVSINGDKLKPGQRCASTSNRNFEGRQGEGVRTHLMSAGMAAATACTGKITDVRTLS